MKQIRFVEETNGQITPNGIRYQRREVYEDRIKYAPKVNEPRLYTMIHNYNVSIRKKGKLTKERVLELYPNAKGFDHVVKSTDEVYKPHKFKLEKH